MPKNTLSRPRSQGTTQGTGFGGKSPISTIRQKVWSVISSAATTAGNVFDTAYEVVSRVGPPTAKVLGLGLATYAVYSLLVEKPKEWASENDPRLRLYADEASDLRFRRNLHGLGRALSAFTDTSYS